MKKFLVLMMASVFSTPVIFAQKGAYIRPSALGVSFVLNDFETARLIRSTSLSSVLNNKQFGKVKEMSPGIAITYFKGLKDHIDFASTIAASFVPIPLEGQAFNGNDQFLLEADASVNLKMFTDKYIFTPYISLGVGGSMYNEKFGAILPIGGGFKINIFNEAAVFIQSQYRIPVTKQNNDYHFFNSIGIAGIIGRKREEPVKEVEIPQAPKDTDGDGITDDVDQCPTVAGVTKYNGCPVPDTDKDGVNDDNDSCLTVPGLPRYNGCPVPDTDKDGVNDELDKCKDVPGVARYDGCPIPDADGDGINDEEDKCPQLAGTRENNGCPEVKQEVVKRVEYAAKNVYFITGSYKLSSKSFKPLNDLVALLNEDKDLKLAIEGHTDNVGADDYNQTLSDNRAKSVKDYLVSKDIDEGRLSSQGFGETQPVADNKTAAGKAKNRRVVMTAAYQ
jgi:outer membrane protein OmpA-like peptidoglycan-associated protein